MTETAKDFRIREFDGSDADYEGLVAVANALEPESPTCVERIRHRDEAREKQYLFKRVLVERDGRIVASANYGESNWSHVPGKYTLYISVHPEYGNRGIGTAVYEYIVQKLADADPAPNCYATWVREDRPVALDFVEKRGFKEIMRENESTLTLERFDAGPFGDLIAGVRNAYEVERLDRLMERDPEALRKLYDLDWIAMQDMPNDDPPVRRRFETYLKIMQPPGFDPRLGYVAVNGDEWVGATLLWHNPAEPDVLGTEITGVLREHRRRGIATALKVLTIADAKELGYRKIRTANAATNPMYDINVRLGFEPEPGWIVYHRRLDDEAAGEDTEISS